MNCKNCGEPIELPPPSKRPRITLFNFTGFFQGLFSEAGIVIMLIVCCVGLPAIFMGGKDEEYQAIKKALETPGIKVEVTKDGDGKVGWKILKEAELPEKKK